MKKNILLVLACLTLAGKAFAQAPSSNSIHVIWPYSVQGIWAFDDKERHLYREPFVGPINVMIDQMVTNIPDANVGFRLLFSAGFIPQYDAKLTWQKEEGGGNWYYCERFNTSGWLCPSLLKFFSTPPKEVFIKAEPLPQALLETWKKRPEKTW